jgi:hypothetical protein
VRQGRARVHSAGLDSTYRLEIRIDMPGRETVRRRAGVIR